MHNNLKSQKQNKKSLLSIHPEANRRNVLINTSLSSTDNPLGVYIITYNLIDICFPKAGIFKHYFLALFYFIANLISKFEDIWEFMHIYFFYESFTCK